MNEQSQLVENHGWRVIFAGLGINLALGILYTWSVISKGIPEDWGWNESDKSLPYMVACLIFALTMVPAGRLQDKIGPRIVASIGGVLVGIGFIIASMTTSPLFFMIGFGLLAGTGIGFGYASATPPAVKWFPAAKTGLIAGIVVSGFGLASVYAAPLAKWLTITYGIQKMVFVLGIAFLIAVVALAQILKPPPKNYIPPGTKPVNTDNIVNKKENFTPKEMLTTVQFYMLWFMYACGAGAGLMIISKLAAIADKQAGISMGFVLVAVLGVGNGAGRIIAGMLSDKIGRKATLFICFASQALIILLLSKTTHASILANVFVLSVLSALIGASYGANLSLFPSITKDYYGLKNFGMNYGLVFTSWGVGGFMLAFLAGKMYDIHQTFNIAYYGASSLLVLAAVMICFLKPPYHLLENAETTEEAVGTIEVIEDIETVETAEAIEEKVL
jgi:OFA family oxalate/formate antiporter-like MFS transporter